MFGQFYLYNVCCREVGVSSKNLSLRRYGISVDGKFMDGKYKSTRDSKLISRTLAICSCVWNID